MQNMFTTEELQLLKRLKEKYASNETEFQNQIQALFNDKGVHYWEYIHLDALLGIQHTKTEVDDEMIFITYHQICELYFKLIRHELYLLTDLNRKEFLIQNNWMKRVGRVINYFNKLTHSFDIMSPGKEDSDKQFFSTQEFLQFRLNLMPASGFQTVSMRKIEMMSTSLQNLVNKEQHTAIQGSELEKQYDQLFWKTGSRLLLEDGSTMKTKTLLAFEKKYDKELLDFATQFQHRNLAYIFFDYQADTEEEKQKLAAVRMNKNVQQLLKKYDKVVNVDWKQNHFDIIKKHMPDAKHGTGGTNWKKYLPPTEQQISYFPDI
ncbi:MAG: hypothetical protein HOD63_13885 [Bacteroidetes bacterium]|jgi:tryptophan 2,3-dioxygenase|nr:hypothetical protein [Bacteroidota bacterium]MBT5528141.1 hypothetical protein [Cytophagia bacterium]MBT3802825.1 hypothetical protein [Bacteroidota bacterium]MBT3935505.1 hypothetical protein [Bacteroidota bacterium]MBT4339679.1 hypothetical protein [Bacteroidota bacterium]